VTSQPSSGPGSGVIASKLTTITSAQLKALFTTPVTVSPTPRSNEVIIPVYWAATAEDSDTNYANPAVGVLSLSYAGAGGAPTLDGLLAALTSGVTSFVESRSVSVNAGEVATLAGAPLTMVMDTGNLTSGDFPVAFTLFYAIIPS
jgi:hypothetical protein